jgi:quercetin dioxygenase-like cupin family protein
MNYKHHILPAVALIGLMISATATAQETPTPAAEATPKVEVRLASEIPWQKLNPARGDASPQAGTIWGDQTKDGESGFLVKFVDGFSSPPHIHNITYRGIVLAGGLHNDDPKAEPMWMKVGSYWTQPAGEVHITSSRGAGIGYVEIQSGPYLVKPETEAFDNGERPINIDSTNIVWLDASNTTWIEGKTNADAAKNAQMTFMWGSPEGDQVNGTMLKLPAGFSGKLNTESSSFKVIVIDGQTKLHLDDGKDVRTLTAGGYFGTEGKASNHVTTKDGCTVYVRTKGKYSVVPK